MTDSFQAWKQERLDIAANFYSQIPPAELRANAELAEKCADLCFEIGKSLFRADATYQGLKWLERAYDTLTMHAEEHLSGDAYELRLCVLQYLIRANLGLKEGLGLDKAAELASLLEQDFPNCIIVPLLKLEILAASSDLNAASYFSELQRLINTGIITDEIFKSILGHVHHLKDHDGELAVEAVDILITSRLLEQDKLDWIEKACVTRIWLTTEKLAGHPKQLAALSQLLAMLQGALREPVSSHASHACQTVRCADLGMRRATERVTASLEKDREGLVCRGLGRRTVVVQDSHSIHFQ